MCGRSSLTKTEAELEERFNATFYSDELEKYNPLPNFNVAPTHMMPVILSNDLERLRILRWGLIPGWANDIKVGYRMINARIETLAEKKSFKNLIATHRCAVPMDGFYEWKTDKKAKIPHRIIVKSQDIFLVAGLWTSWNNPTGDVIHSFTIITQPANKFISDIHDRMPAILTQNQEKEWLDQQIPATDALQMLQPYPSDDMIAYPVDARVGKVSNNDKLLIKPQTDLPRTGELF